MTVKYQFQSVLYSYESTWLQAIAEEWLGGRAPDEADSIKDAEDCIEAWFSDVKREIDDDYATEVELAAEYPDAVKPIEHEPDYDGYVPDVQLLAAKMREAAASFASVES